MIFGEQGALGYGSGTHGHMIREFKSNCKDQVGKINLNFVSDAVTAGLTAQDCIACALKWFLVTLQHHVQPHSVPGGELHQGEEIRGHPCCTCRKRAGY